MERKKQIEVEEKEVSRKDKELVATVKRPAEAESYRVETLAQGKRSVFVNIPYGIISANFLLCTTLVSRGLVHPNHFPQQTRVAELGLPRNMQAQSNLRTKSCLLQVVNSERHYNG